VLYLFRVAPRWPFPGDVCSMCAREFSPSRPGLVTFGPGRGRRRPIGLYLYREWSIPLSEPAERPLPMLSRSVRPAGDDQS